MRYPRHEILVAPARTRPAVWRLVLGLALVVAGQFAVVAVILLVLAWTAPSDDVMMDRLTDLMAPSRPLTTLLVLFSFAGLILMLGPVARALHKRSFGSLFGRRALTLSHFVRAAAAAFVILGLSFVPWILQNDPAPGLSPDLWLALLPVSLLAILIQTGAEELIFRGYLQSQLAARFRHWMIWLILPSVLFGMLHYAPANFGPNAWVAVAAATLFGLIAADLTARTGSIGAAWGLHFANNALAMLLVGTEGSISGIALFLSPDSASDALAPGVVAIDLVLVLATYGVIRRLLTV